MGTSAAGQSEWRGSLPTAKKAATPQVPSTTRADAEPPADLDLAYWAWTVIANVSGGDWSLQSREWVGAAERWRDAFHATLTKAAP